MITQLKMGMSFGSAGGPSLSAQVEAILVGKTGFARDPSDLSTLWQDISATVPVTTAGDPVARWDGKWTSSAVSMQQGASGAQPAFDGTGIVWDGSDDRFDSLTGLETVTNGTPGYFSCVRVRPDNLSIVRCIHAISTNVNQQNPRFQIDVLTDGAIRVALRRPDGATQFLLATAAGLIDANTTHTVTVEADMAGAATLRVWLNGALVLTGALGSPANFSTGNSLRVRDGLHLANSPSTFWSGWQRRRVDIAQAVSDADRATIEAWVGEI